MVDKQRYRNKVAIVGFGLSLRWFAGLTFRSAHRGRFIRSAIADAGLDESDIDGVACGVSLPAYGSTGPQ